jgi:hypothetical protein
MGLFDFLKRKPKQPLYSGGDGKSIETAVVIGARSSMVGVSAEYEYVGARHGKRNVDWKLESQALINQDGKSYDVLKINLNDGESKTYYFDITQFYGKF